MRKVTLKIKPRIFAKLGLEKFMVNIERFDLEELLRLDYAKGIKIGIATFILKKGVSFEDLKWPKTKESVEILNQDGRAYTVLLKTKAPKMYLPLFRSFELDLIWDKPSYYKNGVMTISCIGEEKELKKLMKLMNFFGQVLSVSYNIPDYRGKSILSILTGKQREIFISAKEKGYYEYPRKIDATGLAKDLGLTKATVVEHLRKIENRIFSNIG